MFVRHAPPKQSTKTKNALIQPTPLAGAFRIFQLNPVRILQNAGQVKTVEHITIVN
jgi:hypothetical protein